MPPSPPSSLSEQTEAGSAPRPPGRARWTLAALLFCEIAAIADWATTARLIDGVNHDEHNPIAAWVIAQLGLGGWLLVKLLYVPLGCYLGGRAVRLLKPTWTSLARADFFLWTVGAAQLAAALLNLRFL